VIGLRLNGLLNEGVCELRDVALAFQPAEPDELAAINGDSVGAADGSSQTKKKTEKKKGKGGTAEGDEGEDAAARRQRLGTVRASALAAALHPTTDQPEGIAGSDSNGSGSGGLVGTASVALRAPWVSLPELQGALRGMTAEDVVPPRRELPKKPPRNFQDELRRELVTRE